MLTQIKPQEVSEVEIVFPASVSSLMPPESYDRDLVISAMNGYLPWSGFVGALWAGRVKQETIEMIPRDGIDGETAWRHIVCIMGSYEPKHEHKITALNVLLESWFHEAIWEEKGGEIGVAVSRG